MHRLLHSKWVLAIVLLFAAFGVLAALSLIRTPLTARWQGTDRSQFPQFVPVAYAESPTGDDFAVLQRTNRAMTQIIGSARRSVVSIETTAEVRPSGSSGEGNEGREFPFDLPFDFHFRMPNAPQVPREGVGSGVIVSADGYILTNNHVVEGASSIRVRTDDGDELAAKLVGRDPRTDIAVVKVDADGLTAMPLGDSESLQVGEFVIAIGTPFRLSQSVSLGIVSAKGRSQIIGRSDPESAPYEDFIQTDAAINPGNSGGALVNIYGQLVGVNTAINSRTGVNEGVGFAVPINIARKVMGDLIDKGKVVRAWLGVYSSDVSPEVAKEIGLEPGKGAMVSQVQDDSPASRAGLKPLDIIIVADGKKVEGSNQLRNYISTSEVGKKARLTLLRDGKEREVTVTLGELDEQNVAAVPSSRRESANGWMGVTVEELDPKRAEELGYEGESGVVVSAVEPGSPAARIGLQENTLILEIGGTAVTNLKQFREATKKAGNSAFIKWRRGKMYGLSVLKKADS